MPNVEKGESEICMVEHRSLCLCYLGLGSENITLSKRSGYRYGCYCRDNREPTTTETAPWVALDDFCKKPTSSHLVVQKRSGYRADRPPTGTVQIIYPDRILDIVDVPGRGGPAIDSAAGDTRP
ncbi:hypothetical protein J6590_056488 [Homalodisca vitripennis]|nr:hypothetical protein J6590_056488 [Homalodisca vitripennis]